MLDERGFKPLRMLKDDPGFAKLNWFTHLRLKTPLEKFSSRNDLTLRSSGVTLPALKTGTTPLDHASLGSTGKTPLDYITCISEAFQRIGKGPSYYRRIQLLHKLKGITTYKAKM